jgi:hypothetical protein
MAFRWQATGCDRSREARSNFLDKLQEGFEKKAWRADDLSIRECACETVPDGHDWVESLRPGKGQQLYEADTVNMAMFSHITGQFLFNALMEGLQSEDFVFTPLIPEVSTKLLKGERVPGITMIGDESEVVDEGQPYPYSGVAEDWIDLPALAKRGVICPVTKEAVFSDLTGQLTERCRGVGWAVGLNIEKQAIDCLVDENRTTHRLKWKDTSYASYQTTTPWDNTTASNELVDYTDIDAATQTFSGIIDPWTNEVVSIKPDTLICTSQLELTALRIRNSTDVVVVTPGYATTGNPVETRVGNPFAGKFEVKSSNLLASRMATDTTWYYGSPKKYAKRMIAWPLQVEPAPPNSDDVFNRDIVMKFKASYMGAFAVVQPRVMTKNTVA